jgi:hypothetical protein
MTEICFGQSSCNIYVTTSSSRKVGTYTNRGVRYYVFVLDKCMQAMHGCINVRLLGELNHKYANMSDR